MLLICPLWAGSCFGVGGHFAFKQSECVMNFFHCLTVKACETQLVSAESQLSEWLRGNEMRESCKLSIPISGSSFLAHSVTFVAGKKWQLADKQKRRAVCTSTAATVDDWRDNERYLRKVTQQMQGKQYGTTVRWTNYLSEVQRQARLFRTDYVEQCISYIAECTDKIKKKKFLTPVRFEMFSLNNFFKITLHTCYNCFNKSYKVWLL